MVNLKRTIAATIVCFKPHVFLTLCILLVIAHSVIIGIQKSWRVGRHLDATFTMTVLISMVALIWAAFFSFVARFELTNELEALLVLFHCSKRGLRFLGVVAFHFIMLTLIVFLVSAAVERSIPKEVMFGPSESWNQMRPVNRLDRGYLLVVYKIWLTAIVYAFLYLLIENMTFYYTDLSLVEFVHGHFLDAVTKLTGIDLSDYPAGEMLFNPLIRRRIR